MHAMTDLTHDAGFTPVPTATFGTLRTVTAAERAYVHLTRDVWAFADHPDRAARYRADLRAVAAALAGHHRLSLAALAARLAPAARHSFLAEQAQPALT